MSDGSTGRMRRGHRALRVVAALVVAGLVSASALVSDAQQPRKPSPRRPPPEGHGVHATPKGWKFTWPEKEGDAATGREVFVKLKCYACHEVKGEKLPQPTEEGKVGPELAQMGPLHEAEYFAEAIINPSAAIEVSKGYAAPDGSSKMPSYNDTITVQEVIDLVAYLRALKPPASPKPAAGGGHDKH